MAGQKLNRSENPTMMPLARTYAFGMYRVLRAIIGALGLMSPIRRLAGPVAGRLLFKLSTSGVKLAELHGHKMHLAPPGRYPPLDMAMDRYEPGTTRTFQKTVKPGMVVIDVGAHVGYYSLLAASLVGPTGRIYAFEPEDENHRLLKKNIELNGYENIIVTKIAISDTVGNSSLHRTALDSGRHSMFHHGLPEQDSVTIETTSLDSFLESEGLPSVDLIKVDVEGAEEAVLNGMPQLIERSSNLKLIMEFNPALLNSAGVTPLTFLERLTANNWTVNLIDETDGQSLALPDDISSFVDQLVSSGSSVNLFCTQE